MTHPPVQARTSWLETCLAPIAGLYESLVTLERGLFEAFPFLVRRPAATVVSIGNLSVGGTGKTPLLLELLDDPQRPAGTVVLTRGYRSPWERGFYLLRGPGPHPNGLTDEALLVNRAFPEVPLLIGKNRAHTAAMAEKWFRPSLILLDDGFQYRRLARDIDLVLWDATMDPGTARILPLGRLREPPRRLAEASAILLTRCETASDSQRVFWRQFLSTLAPRAPILETQTCPTGWITPNGATVPLDQGPRRVSAFAAIANPAPFFRLLETIGCEVLERKVFPDHHPFSPEDLVTIAARATAAGAEPVCTEKDRVKLDRSGKTGPGAWTLCTRMRSTDGGRIADALRKETLLP